MSIDMLLGQGAYGKVMLAHLCDSGNKARLLPVAVKMPRGEKIHVDYYV